MKNMMMNMAMMMMTMTMTVITVIMVNKSLTWGNTKIAAMAITAMVAMEPISEKTMAMAITMAMVLPMGTTTMVAMEPMYRNHLILCTCLLTMPRTFC